MFAWLVVVLGILLAAPTQAQIPAFSSTACKAAALGRGGCGQETVGARVVVVDGLTPQDCAVGGGTSQHVCVRTPTGWQVEETPASLISECTVSALQAGTCGIRRIGAVGPQ